MTARSGYCPFCDASIPAPLLPLDYRNCKRCGAVVAEEDIVRRANSTLLMGALPGFNLEVIGTTTMYDATQATDTVTVNTSQFPAGAYILVCIGTVGANQHPNTVTVDGITLTQATAGGSTTHARTSIYYGKVSNSGSGATVLWTGQHPHAAAVVVMMTRTANDTAMIANAASLGSAQASQTSQTLGNSVSPTGGNSYAVWAIATEGYDYFANIPSGYALATPTLGTGTGSQPVDIGMAVFVADMPISQSVATVAPFSSTLFYANSIAFVNKS